MLVSGWPRALGYWWWNYIQLGILVSCAANQVGMRLSDVAIRDSQRRWLVLSFEE